MLLVLFPLKFTHFYYYLLDIDCLKKKGGMDIEIHDLSHDLNKDLSQGFLAKSHKSAKKFYSFDEWKIRFDELNRKKNLTILNFLDFNSFSSLRYYSYLKNRKLKIFRIGSAGVLQQGSYNKKNISYFYNNLVNINFFYKKLYFLLKIKLIIFLYQRFFKLNEVLLISGNKNQKIFSQSKIKKTIDIHSLDYNKAINFRNKKKSKKQRKIILYFDMPKPFFKDDFQLLYKLSPNTDLREIKEHYFKLNYFLKSIEKIYSCKIIIIPHPKVRGIKNPFYDKRFQIDERPEAASELAPVCKFAIYSSFSTSVAYSIASKKPILLLKGKGFEGNFGIKDHYIRGIKTMSKYLSCKVFDYKNNLKKKIKLKLNKKRYDKYKNQFLSNEKLSKIENYQIFNELIIK